jgi:hypothetical protein
MGPFWLTGAGFGLEGSWLAFVVLLLLLPALYAVTRDLDFLHNAPELIPGGIPVDIDAAARRQHEAAMGAVYDPAAPAPAGQSLVQISPLPSLPGEVKPAEEPMPDPSPAAIPEHEAHQTQPESGNESIPH